MRRVTAEELQRKRVAAWISFTVFMLLAVVVLFARWLFPPKPYEELLRKEIVVEKVEYQPTSSKTRALFLYTKDGERYILSGAFENRIEKDENNVSHYAGPVWEKLVPGAAAQIKYFESSRRRVDGYAEEVTVDWQLIVTYDDDVPPTIGMRIAMFCLALFLSAVAVISLKFSLYMIQDREKKEQMRNQRIAKKYGKKTS